MSLAVLANHMASKGRNGDTMLVHMAPSEVAGLQALGLSHGVSMTVNPHTGLPEAFSFKSLLKSALPMIAGFALGPAGFGVVSSALGAGALVGGATALATGSLQKGIMAGLGAYGGANLGNALFGAGSANIGTAAADAARASAIEQGLTGTAQDQFVQKAVADKMAAATLTDRLGAGITGLAQAPGRELFMSAIGGGSGLLKAGYAAAAPIMADQAVQTATPMPSGGGFQYTPRIRPMVYDPYTGGLQQLPMFSAINRAGTTAPAPAPAPAQQEPGGYNGGGIVALAEGGATEEQIRGLYQDVFKREADVGGLEFWKQSGYTPEQIRAEFVKSPEFAAMQQNVSAAPSGGGGGGAPVLTPAAAPIAPPAPTGPYAAQIAAGQEAIPFAQGTAATEQDITDLYYRLLGRAPDIGGLEFYKASQFSPDQIRQNMMQSPEYQAFEAGPKTKTQLGAQAVPYATGTPATRQEIRAIYRELLDRPADAGGLEFYDASQFSPEQIRQNIMQSEEFRNRRVAPVPVVPGPTVPGSTGTDHYGGDTTTPEYTPPQPQITYGEPFRPKPQTMEQVRSAYEQGGGATRMPTITDILPGERSYTQNEAVNLLSGFLKANPNAEYSEVTRFAKSKGIPEYQARSAFNEVRFSGMAGASRAAYDYLMGRGAYPVNQVLPGNAPLMRPYLEASGISSAPGFFGRKTIPTTPTRQNALNASGSGVDVNAAAGGNAGTAQWLNVVTNELRTGGPMDYITDPTWRRVDTDVQAQASGGLASIAAAGAAGGGDVQQYNLGGYSDGGRLLRGPGDGVSDSIPATIGNRQPARLADGEFVIPARIVSEIGNGSTEAGARKLYAMMDRVQRARAKTTGKGKVAKNTRADKHLPA